MGAVGVRMKRGIHVFIERTWGIGAFTFGYCDCACGWSMWGTKKAIDRLTRQHLVEVGP